MKLPEQLAAMRCRMVKADGYVWALTVNPDHGLAVIVGRVTEAPFAAAPDKAFARVDLTPGFIVPPGLCDAVRRPGCDDVTGRTTIGRVPVQARFADIVEHLHKGCAWMAPQHAADGPVRAVKRGRIVALLAGMVDTNREAEALGAITAVRA